MYDITALGELLIDFTPCGESPKGNNMYESNPGGAPANVLSACAKLGMKTAFIGKVGKDEFGVFLQKTLESLNIETKGLLLSPDYNTTLAFVHLSEEGERSFSFYRKPGADMMLNEHEVNYDLIKNSTAFHFGAVSMTSEPSRTATEKAVRFARDHCKIISYDPNLRELLWNSLEEAKAAMLSMMVYCDVLKLSEEELFFLTDRSDPDIGTRYLYEKYNIGLIFVTMGRNGCFYRAKDLFGRAYAYDVNTIDTTGAGDSFIGAILYQLMKGRQDLKNYTKDEMDKMVEFASAMSSLVTTQYGAIKSMPDIDQIYKCMNKEGKLFNECFNELLGGNR